jgi:hypothetical protein
VCRPNQVAQHMRLNIVRFSPVTVSFDFALHFASPDWTPMLTCDIKIACAHLCLLPLSSQIGGATAPIKPIKNAFQDEQGAGAASSNGGSAHSLPLVLGPGPGAGGAGTGATPVRQPSALGDPAKASGVTHANGSPGKPLRHEHSMSYVPSSDDEEEGFNDGEGDEGEYEGSDGEGGQ